MKSVMNEQFHLAKLINKQHFLLKCRKEKVFSKSRKLKNSFGINKDVFQRLENTFVFGVMNEEISATIRNIKTKTINLNLLNQLLQEDLPNNIYEEFIHQAESTYVYHFNQIKVRQKAKFDQIIRESLNDTTNGLISNCDKWLVNVTNIDLPFHVKFILSLGNKFCPPTVGTAIPFFKIISDVESAIFNLNDSDRVNIRNNFINIITNYKNSTNTRNLTPHENRIMSYLKQTKTFLKDNPNILVTRADKGNTTVLTLRTDYSDKMYNLLNDNSTYIQIFKDNSTPIQTKINTLVRDWEKSGNIDLTTKKKLTSYTPVIPKLYGLPKIHKPDIPFRPIVSSIDSPTYSLSTYLGNILKPSVGKTNSFIQNSEDFKSKIKDVTIPPNFLVISLDVTSLFTNVDSQIVINIVSQNWRNIKKNSKSKLTKVQFLTALDIVLNNSEFSFDNKIFKQIFGSPMGSPISPIIANLLMENLEISVLNSLDFQPLFYYRYVDDIITAVPINKIDSFLEAFNSKNNRIKFTLEKETNNQISFLDILLIREPNGKISCDWYHKDTWSGRYLNFHSWLPTSYKINTIKILTQKILKLSDTKFHNKNLKILKDTLFRNQYPEKLINNIIWKQRHFHINPASRPVNEITNYLAIPYVKNLYEKIKNLFKNYNFKIIGRAATSLNNKLFSKIKDSIPLKKQSNVVYQVQCSCNATYTGQTKQFLEKRFYQHRRDVNKDLNSSISALSRHLKDTNHQISLDNIKILDKQKNFKKRSILEMLHIKSSENSINIVEDYAYIGNSYDLFI